MGYWDRFQKYMRGGPEAIDGWPDQIPIEEFNQAVGRTLGSALAENGFEAVAPRRWVRSRHDSIRDVLELQALKGVAYSPAWGFSLDFVPHVTSGGDTKWHRTPKSARFDLVYWPTDVVPPASDTLDWNMSPFATREELEDDLARVTRLVIAQAMPFFERVRAVADLLVSIVSVRVARRSASAFPSKSSRAFLYWPGAVTPQPDRNLPSTSNGTMSRVRRLRSSRSCSHRQRPIDSHPLGHGYAIMRL